MIAVTWCTCSSTGFALQLRADSDEAGSNLLTRFGDSVYLFFVITPPEQTRRSRLDAWPGVGRYRLLTTHWRIVSGLCGHAQCVFTWIHRN